MVAGFHVEPHRVIVLSQSVRRALNTAIFRQATILNSPFLCSANRTILNFISFDRSRLTFSDDDTMLLLTSQ